MGENFEALSDLQKEAVIWATKRELKQARRWAVVRDEETFTEAIRELWASKPKHVAKALQEYKTSNEWLR